MNLNSEIYKYISKTFLFSTGVIILLFASIIFIGDTVEFGKKLSSHEKVGSTLIFILSALNLPKMLLKFYHFAFFLRNALGYESEQYKRTYCYENHRFNNNKNNFTHFFCFYFSWLTICYSF